MDDSDPRVRERVRVFVVDDHEIVRRGVIDLLTASADIVVVGEAGSESEALQLIPTALPDVAIMGARLPPLRQPEGVGPSEQSEGSGVGACREIRSRFPDLECIILTSYDEDEALFATMMAGAEGYLLKQVGGGSLIEAVHDVAAGKPLLDPHLAASLLDRLRNPPLPDPRVSPLTANEDALLQLIGIGLSNKQIGEQLLLAERRVKADVSALLSKLDIQRRAQGEIFGAEVPESPTIPSGAVPPPRADGRLQDRLNHRLGEVSSPWYRTPVR